MPDLFTVEHHGRALSRRAWAVDSEAVQALLQCTAGGRALDCLLAQIASLIERDSGVEPSLERDGLVAGVDTDTRKPVLDAQDFKRLGPDLYRAGVVRA